MRVPDKHTALMDHYDHICRQIRKMTDDSASWCGMGCELREIPAEYFVEASERVERVERKSVGASERRSVKAEPATYALRSSRSRRCSRSKRS